MLNDASMISPQRRRVFCLVNYNHNHRVERGCCFAFIYIPRARVAWRLFATVITRRDVSCFVPVELLLHCVFGVFGDPLCRSVHGR